MFSDYYATRYLDYLLGVPYYKSELDGMSVNRIHAVEFMSYRYVIVLINSCRASTPHFP
jgi:hypothetical protein